MDSMAIQSFSLFCTEITIFLLKLWLNCRYFRQTALFFKKLRNLWVQIMISGSKEKN